MLHGNLEVVKDFIFFHFYFQFVTIVFTLFYVFFSACI